MLGWSQMKAFADDKINLNEPLKFVSGRIEHTFGEGKNAGYQHFLLFPKCFQKLPFSGSFKVGIVWKRVKLLGKKGEMLLTIIYLFYNNVFKRFLPTGLKAPDCVVKG